MLDKVNVCFLGSSGAGKTSLIKYYSTGSFSETTTPTIAAQAYAHKETTVGDQELSVHLWDTAGQEIYRGLAPHYYRKAQIMFLVFSLNSADSWNDIDYWMNELQDNVDVKTIQIAIVGNKSDLDQTVDEDKICRYVQQKGATLYKTSCVTGFGVDAMFKQEVSKYVQNAQAQMNSAKAQSEENESTKSNEVNIKSENPEPSSKQGCGC